MAQQGGAREGSGRKPGKVSELKKQLSVLAKEHAETALNALVKVAKNGESEAARVSASVAILDRAFGRPTQALQHVDEDDRPTPAMSHFEVARRLAFILERGRREVAEDSGPSETTQSRAIQ